VNADANDSTSDRDYRFEESGDVGVVDRSELVGGVDLSSVSADVEEVPVDEYCTAGGEEFCVDGPGGAEPGVSEPGVAEPEVDGLDEGGLDVDGFSVLIVVVVVVVVGGTAVFALGLNAGIVTVECVVTPLGAFVLDAGEPDAGAPP